MAGDAIQRLHLAAITLDSSYIDQQLVRHAKASEQLFTTDRLLQGKVGAEPAWHDGWNFRGYFISLSLPARQTSIEQGDSFMPHPAQQPPKPCGHYPVAG